MISREISIDLCVAQVRAALEGVSDPELDESVVELGFVTSVEVDLEGGVDISFRLPTYWCASNFAFLMADDMRQAAAALPWVTRVAVRLVEHMNDAQINQGLAHNLSFDQTFGSEANGNLDEVRQIFAVKAFQRRQEKLLRHLLTAGHAAAELVKLSLVQLAVLPLDAQGLVLRMRYLERRGIVSSGESDTSALAFVDKAGVAIVAKALPVYLRGLRLVSVNTDFNGALCRGLLAARYGADLPGAQLGANVFPIHFMRTAAPGRPGCTETHS
jgi:metal-sulfur cluster biosynthetic enzyme